MTEFLSMGGYAPYVWTAYGITLVVIVLNVWSARRRHLQALSRVRRMTAPETSDRRPTVRRNP